MGVRDLTQFLTMYFVFSSRALAISGSKTPFLSGHMLTKDGVVGTFGWLYRIYVLGNSGPRLSKGERGLVNYMQS